MSTTKSVENMAGVAEMERVLHPPWNFSWVVEGEICGCAWPDTESNIAYLKSQGVGALVTLSEERQPKKVASNYVRCYLIPVEEFEEPTMAQIDEFIAICDKARENKEAVCVHCRMGRGRTGVMLACYLAVCVHCRMGRGRTGVMIACYLVKYHKLIPSAAVRKVRYKRPYSIETFHQESVVKDYWDYLAWGHL